MIEIMDAALEEMVTTYVTSYLRVTALQPRRQRDLQLRHWVTGFAIGYVFAEYSLEGENLASQGRIDEITTRVQAIAKRAVSQTLGN